MPLVSHRVTVKATVERLWEMMLEKIEHPDRYVPGVEDVRIVRRMNTNAVERIMQLRQGESLRGIHEYISWSAETRTVVFVLVDDPQYTGFVVNTILHEPARVELDYTMHWVSRGGRDPENAPDWQATVAAAVEHARRLAETGE